jgi:hypothetical protein
VLRAYQNWLISWPPPTYSAIRQSLVRLHSQCCFVTRVPTSRSLIKLSICWTSSHGSSFVITKLAKSCEISANALITDLLEERRNWMRTKMQQILFDGLTDTGTDNNSACTCAWSSRHSLAHTELLQNQELQPLQILTITISEVVERLEQMEDPAISGQWAHYSYRWHRTPRYRAIRRERLRELHEKGSLCIDSLRSSTTATNKIHRVKH